MRDNIIEDLLSKKKQYNGAEFREFFSGLPNKAQEMLFEYLEVCSENETDGFPIFLTFDIFETVGMCESPIEKIFAMAVSLLDHVRGSEIWIFPQHKIKTGDKKYRVDFLCEYKDYNLIIECDGHEYHKATKEQVANDNERDLELKKAGYDILRFSGSQIYNNPWKCAYGFLEYYETKVMEYESREV